MATAPGLVVEVSANTAKFDSDMSRMAQIARTQGDNVKASMLDAANSASHGFSVLGEKIGLLENPISRSIQGFGAMGAAAGLVAGAAYGFGEAVSKAVEMGESMADLSIKTGLSVESISRFSLVARLAGTDMDTISQLMKKLSISAVEATTGHKSLANVYESLGISVKELRTLAPDELMVRVAQAIKGLDPMVVQDVMKQIGGKGGSDALVFLRELNERFDDTHSKISTQFAADAKEFSDNMKLMSEGAAYLGVSFASKLVPELNIAIDAFKEARKAGEGFFAAMGAAIQSNSALMGYDIRNYKNEILKIQDELKTATGERATELTNSLKVLQSYGAKNEGALANPLDAEKNASARSALSKNNNSTGDNFLEGLKARIAKADEGEVAMLRLQAAEKGVAEAAAPLLQKLVEINENKSATLYENSLLRQNDTISYQATLIGKTSQEVEILNLQHANTLELQRQLETMTKQYGDVSAETTARMTQDMQRATATQVASIQARQQAETLWSFGSQKAIQDYVISANNAASSSKMLFTNAFNSMENAIVQFAMTGQLSFSNMANSIIADIIRIQARMAISGLATSIFGGVNTSATEGAANFIGPPAALANAQGNAFMGGNVIPFAKGGVVSSPTLFPMANGAGLMGEAGPEAVMPLARDGSGRLGVRGGGGGGTSIEINVQNNAAGDGYQASATSKESNGKNIIDIVVEKVKTSMNQDVRNNGNFSQTFANAYGLRRSM
jgi:lambda family phage tail tape measure protein